MGLAAPVKYVPMPIVKTREQCRTYLHQQYVTEHNQHISNSRDIRPIPIHNMKKNKYLNYIIFHTSNNHLSLTGHSCEMCVYLLITVENIYCNLL